MSARDADTEAPQDPGECLACRGTGRLISGLGGTPHEVRCPWCEGTGIRIPGIDAQAHPAESGATAATAAEGTTEQGTAEGSGGADDGGDAEQSAK